MLETILLALTLSTSPETKPSDLSLEQTKQIMIQQEQINTQTAISNMIADLSKGRIALSQGLEEEAKEFYIKGLETYEKLQIPMLNLERKARTELGKTYFKLGEHKNMIKEFAKAYMIAPYDPAGMNNLALGLAVANSDLESAEILSRHAVELEPKKVEYNGTLGFVLGLRGKFKESINATEKAIQNAGENNNSHLEFYYNNLIEAHKQLDQTEKVQKYQTLLEKIK